MFYDFLTSFAANFSPFWWPQLLIRSAISALFAFTICYITTAIFIKKIHQIKLFQPIRTDGPQSHLSGKKNTPTMGGLMIISSALLTSLLFLDLHNQYLLVVLLVMVVFASIGFVDDFLKVTKKNTQGFRGSIKLIIQFAVVGAVFIWLGYINNMYLDGQILIPFSNYSIQLGTIYVFFALLVIVGSSNAVNLTDGLDGLVSVPVIISLICLGTIIYATGNFDWSAKLNIPRIENIEELMVFIAVLIGAILAFLKFNLKPAKIFMGDVGSLGLGATLGILAIIANQELVFAIIGLLFVIEALSVIIQVSSYKIRKKRVFLMAPIHHHFEKLGWNERKVVYSFWLASLIFAALGMVGFIL